MDQGNSAAQFKRTSEDETAMVTINEIIASGSRGVRLLEGWRDKRPFNLAYLDTLVETLLAQLKAS